MKTVRSSGAYKFLATCLHNVRTMARRTVWGDRLFLQFKGPTTILMSSRGVRVADVLSGDQINEIADAPAGALPAAMEQAGKQGGLLEKKAESEAEVAASNLHVASAQTDGKVVFEEGKQLKDSLR